MGNPLLDISAEVPSSFLEKYDAKLNNAVLANDKQLPLYKELVDSYQVQYIAGGATQNTIRVAQWMIQKPGACSYIGSVGKDKFGEQLRKSAEGDGLRVYYHEDDKAPTGTCAVLIHKKERSLVANLGAANEFKIEHLHKPHVKAVWEKAQIFYIAGYFLTVSPPSIMLIAEHARQNSKVFAMNLAAPFICQAFSQPLLEAIPFCDYIFGNESEAKAFAQTVKLEDESPKAVASYIGKLEKRNASRCRTVVITNGGDPVVVYTEGKVHKFPVPPISASEIVDFNGAGDAFVGGFLAYLAHDSSLELCVRAGTYASATILRVSGTTLSGTPKFDPSG